MTRPQRRYPPIYKPLYDVAKGFFAILYRLLTRLHVEGLERVPREGPLIVVANHLSYIDAPTLFVAIPLYMHALGAEKYEFHPLFGPLLRVAGTIFIERGEVDRNAMRQALNVLADGEAMAMAIEGTRSKTGGLQVGKTGVAYFATRTNVMLQPVVVYGSEEVLPSLTRFRRADVFVRFGEPFMLPEGRARSADLDRYTEDIMLRLAAMLPEKYRGVYRDHPALPDYTAKLAVPAEIAHP